MPSDFESFLSQQKGPEVESVGEFSLNAQRALEKLAEFRLPFEGAWALKLVQAGVVNDHVARIEITQKRDETFFAFPGETPWTAAEVLKGLVDPTDDKERSMGHLCIALRDLGFGHGQAFRFEFRGRKESLDWDGTRLEVIASDRRPKETVLRVAMAKPVEDRLSARKAIRARNVSVSRALYRFAFTCPKPLSLDRRRLDSLDHCPYHGYGTKSQVLALTCHDHEALTSFSVPFGATTYGHPSKMRLQRPRDPKLVAATRSLRQVPDSGACGLAILLAAHLGEHELSRGLVPGRSRINWIKDGVRIQSSTLELPERGCGVGIFLSADELPTDLTTFSLQKSEETSRLEELAMEYVPECLKSVLELDLDEALETTVSNAPALGLPLMGLGAMMSMFVPFKGIALLLTGIGVASTSSRTSLAPQLRSQLEQLAQDFAQRRSSLEI